MSSSTITATTEKKTGGDAILDVLSQYSIEYVFTSPIAALAPFWEAFAKRKASGDTTSNCPKYINCRHETLAVSLAIGYYKSTGKLPVVCLPTGLGVLNGSMALRTARMEHIPMLIISPDTLTFGEDPTKDPGPEWPTFLIDDAGPAKHADSVTKWNIACRTSYDLHPNLHRAIYVSTQLPKGPALVEIPFDIIMDTDANTLQNRMPALTSDSVVASPEHIQHVAGIIASASNPIIITEHFGSSSHAVALLDSLAKNIAAPVYEWWMPSYNNFDRSSALHGKGFVEEVLGEADVVIVLCSNGPWHGPNQKLKNGCKVIVIDEAPLRPNSSYWGYTTTCCVSGDPTMNVESILKCLFSSFKLDEDTIAKRFQGWEERNKLKQKAIEDEMAAEATKVEEDGKCVHASVVFQQLAQSLPKGSIIVDEMVSQVPSFTHYFFQQPEKEFLHYRGWQGGLGTGIGVALGAKLAHPDRTVVCAIGDGAFNYNPIPSCLGFSQQYNVPIIILVMNNSGYMSQNWNMHKYFPEGSALANGYLPGSAIDPSPKYSLLPPVWGGYGERVETNEELTNAFEVVVKKVEDQFVLLDVSCTP